MSTDSQPTDPAEGASASASAEAEANAVDGVSSAANSGTREEEAGAGSSIVNSTSGEDSESPDSPEREEGAKEPAGKSERVAALGSLIAAIAAVVALVFSGVATLYSVRVSEDQLENSRKEDLEEKKAQAIKVNAWVDSDLSGKRWNDFVQYIYIENRSADTAYAPVVYFDSGMQDPRVGQGKEAKGDLAFAVGRFLPACTRIKIRTSLVVQRYNVGNLKGGVGGSFTNGVGINFYDSSGVAWDRFSGDRSEPPRLEEVKGVRKLTNPWYGVWYLEEIKQVGEVTKADNCEAD